MPRLGVRLLVLGGGWAVLAAFQAPPGPWLRYDPAAFADDCLAPEYRGQGCGAWGETDSAPWLSASAALLAVEGRQPETPRLRYELAGLADLDESLANGQRRARPDL